MPSTFRLQYPLPFTFELCPKYPMETCPWAAHHGVPFASSVIDNSSLVVLSFRSRTLNQIVVPGVSMTPELRYAAKGPDGLTLRLRPAV